jgi:hypothetical protein
MNRRVLHRCALWLLPLLAVRALVPTGFMVSVDAQGLDLTFCPSQSPALVRALADMQVNASDELELHAGTEHGAAADGAHIEHPSHHGSGQEIQVVCPYALASTPATVDVPWLPSVAFGPADEAIAFLLAPSNGFGPVGTHRIRGPPVLS